MHEPGRLTLVPLGNRRTTLPALAAGFGVVPDPDEYQEPRAFWFDLLDGRVPTALGGDTHVGLGARGFLRRERGGVGAFEQFLRDELELMRNRPGRVCKTRLIINTSPLRDRNCDVFFHIPPRRHYHRTLLDLCDRLSDLPIIRDRGLRVTAIAGPDAPRSGKKPRL